MPAADTGNQREFPTCKVSSPFFQTYEVPMVEVTDNVVDLSSQSESQLMVISPKPSVTVIVPVTVTGSHGGVLLLVAVMA